MVRPQILNSSELQANITERLSQNQLLLSDTNNFSCYKSPGIQFRDKENPQTLQNFC